MNICFFGAKPYDRRSFDAVNPRYGHEITFLEARLDAHSAPLARAYKAVCVFVNDVVDAAVLELLAEGGTRIVALRCAGFNNVDLAAAERHGLTVVRVPAYSPHAVAEHTLALILALNRRIHRAYNRVREGNFALDGLLGFDLHGLTAGVVGTGKIGVNVVRILNGFGCRVLAHDPYPNEAARQAGASYAPLDELIAESDILSLHCPLTPESHHLINHAAVERMKPGVMLINTSRGALIDTTAAIDGLKSGQIGYLGIDVYEQEGDVFFEDLSDQVIQDDELTRLMTFPNVLITGHQAFFTSDALENIAETTLGNLSELESQGSCANQVVASP